MGMDYAAVKQWFFDRQAVMSAADRGTIKVLSKFGGSVRLRSQRSMREPSGKAIRQGKAISAPGSPPNTHTGLLKRAILYSYDPSRKSVVIGPVQMGKSGQGARVLEEGGTQTIPGLRNGRPLFYRKRPYMLPAFMAALPSVPESFKGVIR